MKTLTNNLGLSYLFTQGTLCTQQLNYIIQRIYDQHNQCWVYSIENCIKLNTYCTFKTCFQLEPYLLKVENPRHSRALSRLRCSALSLAIEEGRYNNTGRHYRKCIFCNLNAIESEYHFVLVCPLYKELRSQLLPRYYCSRPTLTKLRS